MRGTFWLGVGFLVLGVVLRLHVYLLCFPIWGDEAALALNFVTRDFRGLVYELDYFQLSPLLFLWIEKAVFEWLGPSELALRLVPLLASIAGLVLFWHLTRTVLAPLPAALASGCLAVARTPILMAATIKPYSLDLLLATMLITFAVHYLRAPQRRRWLAALALVIPFAVGASYPVVFVAGAVSLVLLPVVWRSRSLSDRCWFVAFNVLCVACFVAQLRFVGQEIYNPEAPAVKPYMATFWEGAFFPHRPLLMVPWFINRHVGRMFSYPVRWNGGGLLGLVLLVLGARALYRMRQFALVGLCLIPFALNFVAAVLHRYPYGGDQRLDQHLAPGLCILMASGAADLIHRLASSAAAQRRWVYGIAAVLVLVGVGGAVWNAVRPYYNVAAPWARDVARHLHRLVRPEDQIVVRQSESASVTCLHWQLLPLKKQVRFAGQVDWARLEASGGRLWFLDHMVTKVQPPYDDPSPVGLRDVLSAAAGTTWHETDRNRFLAKLAESDLVFLFCCDVHVVERFSGRTARSANRDVQVTIP